MTEDWTKEWERRVVNGVYPLRRFLGRSNHSVVFLTECKAQNVAQAAIKILPAHRALSEAQLSHWRKAATLSHPHLIRLLDAGRCQRGGHNFLFVVTDLAEQHLGQILPSRPLTPDEVRDLLPATLGALAYLHGHNLVQGGLKPSNFLVVDDRLKLASDTIRPAGERTANTAKPSLYDPPEIHDGRMSTAGDIWGLGITLAEALTQTPPAWNRERFESVPLPANLAPEFLDTVQRCLNLSPARRPTIAELLAQFKLAPPTTPSPTEPPAPPTSAAPPLVESPPSLPPPSEPPPSVPPAAIPPSPAPASAAPAAPRPAESPPDAVGKPKASIAASPAPAPTVTAPTAPPAPPPAVTAPPVATPEPTPNPPNTRLLVTASGVGIITLLLVWTGVHLLHTHAGAPQTASIAPRPPPVVSPAAVVEKSKPTIAASPPEVLHQQIPDVSRSARATIHGVIKIAVRVIVDRAGNVFAATLDNRASSRYFARAALDAAKQWKFAEDADQVSRVWLVRFEFTRAGTAAHAAAVR